MEKVSSTEERQIASKRWSDIEKKGRVLFAGIALFLGAVTLSNCSNGSSINKESPAHTRWIDNGNCNNQNQINVEYSGNPDEIIPQKSNNQEISKVNDDNRAAKYLEGLFSKNGPMGKNYDPAVIATFWALIGYPATTDGYQTKDSILATFSSSYNQMTTNNKGFNNLSANKFCKVNETIMSQTFDYENIAIAKGNLITQIDAVTKNGKIDNIDLKSFNAKDNISGIVFKIQNKSALNGFIEVVIDDQGNVWVIGGFQPTSGGSSSNSQSKSISQFKSSNQSQNSSGGGGVTGNGKIQENLSGNSVGNSSGGTGNGSIGNSNESTSGTGNTPSGGTSGGNIPTTTEIPTTTTETTTPTTPTTSPVQKNQDPNQGGCKDPFDPTCQ